MKRLSIIVAITLAATGPLVAAEQASQVGTNADVEIARYIKERFERDKHIFSPELRVIATNGRVTVSGTVATLGEERRALALAEETRGVNEVVDEIKVDVPRRPDEEIRNDVRAALARDSGADPYQINIGVTNGIVILTGTVDSLAERELAIRATWYVRGVRAIENQIGVQPKQTRRDYDIEGDVRGLIQSDVRLSGLPLQVAVKNGLVVLNGIVVTPAQRAIAAELAQVQGARSVDVSGVRVSPAGVEAALQEPEREQVRSKENVTVGPRARIDAPGSPQHDAVIQQAMNAYFSAHPNIDAAEVRLRMENGTAYLEGEVGTPNVRGQIIQTLKNLSVTRIVDKLTVRAEPAVESPAVDTAQRLRAMLGADPYLSDDRIDVSVLRGRASLAGEVDSIQEKLRATEIAQNTLGVTNVLNALSVPSQKVRLVERQNDRGGVTIIPFNDEDNRLRARVRDQLFFDPFLDGSNIRIAVENRVVELTGAVKSDWARLRAVENAYQAGALSVIDRMRTAP